MTDIDIDQRIHEAAKQGSIIALQAELNKGVHIDLAGDGDRTPLHFAVQFNKLEAVKFLVEQKATVDKADDTKRTALHVAAVHNVPLIAKFLLESGAEINQRDVNGETPLMTAVEQGKFECAKLLVIRKADTTVKATSGAWKDKTALDIAEENQRLDIMAMLRSSAFSFLYEAATGHVRKQKANSIHWAAEHGLIDWLEEALLEGVDIDQPDEMNRSPLHHAVNHKKFPAVKYLVERKASVNKVDDRGWTALQFACMRDFTNIAAFLLDNFARINDANSSGDTALIIAIEENRLESVKLLVERKADFNVAATSGRWKGKTALEIAKAKSRNDIVALLAAAIAAPTISEAQSAKPHQSVHSAAAKGDVKTLQEELSKGVTVDLASLEGDTPLVYAAREGKLNAVRFLVEHKAAVDKPGSNDSTPLHWACFHDYVDIAIVLLDSGADLNPTNDVGETPLMKAIDEESLNCAKLLIQRKANTTVKDTLSNTALSLAMDKDMDEIIALLSETSPAHEPASAPVTAAATAIATATASATVTATAPSISVPIVATPSDSVTVATPISQSGSSATRSHSVSRTTGSGFTLRDGTQVQRFHLAAKNGDIKGLREELDKGVGIDAPGQYGRSALHFAALSNHLAAVKFLVEQKATVDKQSNNAVTALHYAAYSGWTEIVEFLLDSRAELNRTDALGQTPLIAATENDQLSCVKLLLGRDADVTEIAREGKYRGKTALLIARSKGLKDIAGLLSVASAAAAPPNLTQKLHVAAEKGDVKELQEELHRGVGIDLPDKNGNTALHCATLHNRLTAVKFLIEQKAALEQTTNAGWNALHLACYYDVDVDIVAILLSSGADIDRRTSNSADTPLQLACENNKPACVKLLLERKADVAAEDERGQTALDIAKRKKLPEIVALLSAPPPVKFEEAPSQQVSSPLLFGNSIVLQVEDSKSGVVADTALAKLQKDINVDVAAGQPLPLAAAAAAAAASASSNADKADSRHAPHDSYAQPTQAQSSVPLSAADVDKRSADSVAQQKEEMERKVRHAVEQERKQLQDAQRESEEKIRQLEQAVAALKLKADVTEVAVIKSSDVIKLPSTPLGRGSFKTAWLCEWRGKRVVKLEFAAGAEFKHLEQLRHSNVVRLLAACDGEQALITEYCERGSLADLIAKPENARWLTDERKWQLLLQMASALEFLHSRKPAIVHRDIKSSNVLVTQAWLAKLADFGLARLQMHTAGLSTVNAAAGTFAFQAPEQFEEASAHEDDANNEDEGEDDENADAKSSNAVRVGIQADIYGFAGVMLHMLTGRSPFDACQPSRIITDKLVKRQPPPELKLLLKSKSAQSKAQAQFLTRCFAFVPTDRPTADAVVGFCRAQLSLAEESAMASKEISLESLNAKLNLLMEASALINSNVMSLSPSAGAS